MLVLRVVWLEVGRAMLMSLEWLRARARFTLTVLCCDDCNLK